MKAKRPVDCHGRTVEVGMRVRVLRVSPSLQKEIPPDEWQNLQSMVGEVLEVSEIDEYGSAWVEKTWDTGADRRLSHSLALAADEMEIA
jgi:hypothetical protein